MKHIGDQTIGAHTDIHRANDQVMGPGVVNVRFFVGSNAFILIVPFRQEEPDRPRHKLRQVTIDKPGVFASELDVSVEGQVIADEDAGAGDNASWERFIVAVSETQDVGIILALVFQLGVDFHESEIPLAFMGQGMGLVSNTQVCPFEGSLNGGNQIVMRDRMPA